MPDLTDLPDDDEEALVVYIDEFEAEYQNILDRLSENDDTRTIGITFMNNVLAAARALHVSQFDSWELPDWNDAYKVVNDFRLFTRGYVISMQIKKSRLAKAFSVSLDAETKTKIHNYLSRIRKLLEEADLDERKRNSLYAKLNTFAADVDRGRTRFDNAMAFIVDAASTAKKVGEGLNPISELIKRINELLGHAKELEGDVKLPPPVRWKQIEGPKKVEPTFSRELDEDIPF